MSTRADSGGPPKTAEPQGQDPQHVDDEAALAPGVVPVSGEGVRAQAGAGTALPSQGAGSHGTLPAGPPRGGVQAPVTAEPQALAAPGADLPSEVEEQVVSLAEVGEQVMPPSAAGVDPKDRLPPPAGHLAPVVLAPVVLAPAVAEHPAPPATDLEVTATATGQVPVDGAGEVSAIVVSRPDAAEPTAEPTATPTAGGSPPSHGVVDGEAASRPGGDGQDAVPPSVAADQPPDEDSTGRGRLVAALRPRATRGQVLSGVLCLLLGLAMAVQLRANNETDLASLRQSELIGLLDDTTESADRLQQEVRQLTTTRDELLSSSDQSTAARELARERLGVLGVLAGTVAATGPGIELTITGGDVDADLLLAAVQELRDAGAEAIQVNDVRVVASTYFLDAPGAPEAADPSVGPVVDVGGSLIQAPFTFSAIGSARTLASAMEFPGGVQATVTVRGGTAVVRQLDQVEVSALRPVEAPAYAQSAEPPTDPSAP